LLATYGEDAVRAAFRRGLDDQAIGAEYIAHYLTSTVTTPHVIEGDSTGHPGTRSSFVGHPDGSPARTNQLNLALAASEREGGRS